MIYNKIFHLKIINYEKIKYFINHLFKLFKLKSDIVYRVIIRFNDINNFPYKKHRFEFILLDKEFII